MMTLLEFIERLESRGVELWVQEDRLRYRGDSDVLTPEVLAELKDRKSELLALQRERTMRSTLCPLAHGQSALYLLHELAPDSPAYNVGFAARVRSSLNTAALESALQTLTARHESLRTTFPKRDGLPVQEIHQRLLPGFETVGAAGVNETELMQRVVQANERPFDLEHGPLLRACVFSVSDSDHVLIVSVHHLVCDAWSLWQFLEELGTCYLQEQGIATPALRPVTARYSDYVRWQRNFLAGPDGERLLAFWKGRLAGELPILNLPTDHPRPAVQNFRGSSVRFQLSASLTSQIKALAMAEGATLYVVLLAAFEILIHRYSGQEEIIVGSPMSGRTQREYADVIGNFINTVALASSSAGDPGFRDFLAKTMRTALDGIAHQDFPFSLLVERMRIPRDPGRTPLFQVLFNFLKPQRFQDVVELWVAGETGQDVQWGGLPLRAMSLPQQEGQFDLTLGMIEGKACLFGDLKYNSDIYDRETVARMARHYEMLLQSIADDPGKSVSALQLLCEPERRKLLVEWNQTQHDFPSDKCVHELFEEQVERTPEAIAVVFEDQRLTYRELDKRANQLARHLQKVGVGPETLVGICVERSLEVVIALLGILKAGGAYVPLDPQYPKERLAFMLEDAQPKVLLIQQRWLKSLPDHPAQVVRLDADWPIISGLAGTRVQKQTTAENLAYVIYTSGSTGRPKGVLLEHRGLCNLVQAQTEEFEIRTDSRVLQFASLNFDASVSEIFTALLVGAVLVVARKESMLPGADLVRLLQEQAVSVVTLPPSVLAVMPSEEFPALRTVISAGEPCTAEIASRWGQGRRFINAYGPTESTVCASLAVCLEGKGRPSIGRPIANTQIYILDRHLQPVPIGVPGELHIGGIGLARGYHNRPELTAEKFIAHPFSTDPGSRIYKTGDLARYLPDGAIEYLGRLDHQVKLRGFRIELGEIESVLSQQAGVKSCIVVLREDRSGDKRLVAYYVGAAGLEAAKLRNGLREHLPEFMVPSAFVALEAFPLNPSGKVDRKALPKPDLDSASDGGRYVPPQTQVEADLARIWSELLGVKQVGVQDNFFDLGGHSLLAMSLQTRIEKELGRRLPLLSFFQNPTIAELALVLSSQATPSRRPSLTPLNTRSAGPSLVFLIGQGSMELYNLAKLLKEECSLHAVLAPLPESVIISLTRKDYAKLPSMEEMAAVQTALIKGKTFPGPLLLTGYCFRGVLAYETARQLRAAGVGVAGVILLDTWMRRATPIWRRKIWIQGHIRTALRKGPGYVWKKLRSRVEFEKARFASERELIRSGNFDREVPWVVMERIYMNAMRRYRPKPLDCRGVVIEPKEDWWVGAYQQDPTLGAGALFEGGVEVLEVPGNHLDILKRHNLPELARAYRVALRYLKNEKRDEGVCKPRESAGGHSRATAWAASQAVSKNQ